MGSTEQEQAEAMKRYIREVFIPEYAKNFNKNLGAEDIKFFGKIHFERERSEKASFLHCHLIVSRKDQSNKLKISPLTNHRNTKKGAIQGGFNRVALFENVEKGFDRLFGYDRGLKETFEYWNTMKNGNIDEKLMMQERAVVGTYLQPNAQPDLQTNVQPKVQSDSHTPSINVPDLGLSSALGLFTPEPNPEESRQPLKPKKKKRRKFGRQM